jgi:hypothetical protein
MGGEVPREGSSNMIPEVIPEDALKLDLARTLHKVRRARAFNDLAANLIQSSRASALIRRLRQLRIRRRADDIAA